MRNPKINSFTYNDQYSPVNTASRSVNNKKLINIYQDSDKSLLVLDHLQIDSRSSFN